MNFIYDRKAITVFSVTWSLRNHSDLMLKNIYYECWKQVLKMTAYGYYYFV